MNLKSNRYIINYLCVILAFVLTVGCSQAKRNNSSDFSDGRFLGIDTFFNNLIEKKQLAGAITLIAQDGKIRHLKSYGFLDVENAIPMNSQVVIPIASMTKVITSIAILKLYEDGQLLLDDPIEKYIPEFADMRVLINPDSTITEPLQSKPTIRDLLRHTSGMVYSFGHTATDQLYKDAGFHEWKGSLHDFVKKVAEIPLAFQPNEKWEYSYSYDVLGFIVETVSGTTLDRFFTSKICKPLGLNHTGFFLPKEKSNMLSNLYVYENGMLRIDDSRYHSIYMQLPEACSGGGGWWSSYGGMVTTIEEFYVICDMLLNYGKYKNINILNRKTVEMMIANQIGDLDAYGDKYGLGVGINSKDYAAGMEEIYWAGSPYNTCFRINYREKLVSILFTNTAPFHHVKMMDTFEHITMQSLTNITDMNQENLKATIIAMEKAALEEWNQGNPTGYLNIYAEDFTYFDPFQEKRLDGFEQIKALYESLRGSVQAEKYEMIDPVVQIVGEMAVLSYNLVSYSGDSAYRWNCTEVYQQQPDKQWKIIHNHWSLTRPMDMK